MSGDRPTGAVARRKRHVTHRTTRTAAQVAATSGQWQHLPVNRDTRTSIAVTSQVQYARVPVLFGSKRPPSVSAQPDLKRVTESCGFTERSCGGLARTRIGFGAGKSAVEALAGMPAGLPLTSRGILSYS